MKIQDIIITKDPSRHGQVYILLKSELKGVHGCVKRTVELEDLNVNVDLDENEEVIGVEVL